MKTIFATLILAALTGCASVDGVGGNTAYIKAHEAQASARTIEVQAKANADTALVNALATTSAACTSDGCRGMAFMAMSNVRNAAAAAVATAPAAIAAPVNEALEGFKTLAKTAIDLYSLRVGAVIKLGEMGRGAGDKDVLRDSLSTLDVYRGQ
jgi:hypothetical protein